MPITVGYEDPAALGAAAYQAGLGQYAQYQQAQALREQEMALRERQFASDQEQQAFRNQFAVAQAQADQYNRNRALNMGWLQDQQQLGFRRDALNQEAASQQSYNQTRLMQQAMENQARQEQQQMLMARDQAQIMAQADHQRMQEQARRAAADWEALQKARMDGRTFLNEGEYQQAVDRWQQMYGGMGERMPLPFVEEPSQNPMVPAMSEFLGFDASPFFDPNTGEPLMDMRYIIQMGQIKQQERAAQEKAKIDEQKAIQEADLKQQEIQQKQQEENQKWRDSFIEQESDAESKRMLAIHHAGKDESGNSKGISRRQAWLEYPPPVVHNKIQYENVPHGMAYRDLDGKIWVKGYEHQGPKN